MQFINAIILSIPLLTAGTNLNAQTFDEWFSQKETQMKYLVQQIATLKSYSAVLNNGYDIIQNGLTSIFKSKEGDYKQQSDYLLSLWKVKPLIKSYGKVLSILQMKADVENQKPVMPLSITKFLTPQERDYIHKVNIKLAKECKDLTDELDTIIGDDQLQLKDDDRILRIDKIYSEMRDRYEFSRSFLGGITLLVLNRLKEETEADQLSSQYDLK